MAQLLHILTKPQDALAAEVIAEQKANASDQVVVADLTVGEPDYDKLVQEVFGADSVSVW